jgi:hypothetical protein
MKSGGFAPNKEENTSRTNKRKTGDSDEALRRAENDFFYNGTNFQPLHLLVDRVRKPLMPVRL